MRALELGRKCWRRYKSCPWYTDMVCAALSTVLINSSPLPHLVSMFIQIKKKTNRTRTKPTKQNLLWLKTQNSYPRIIEYLELEGTDKDCTSQEQRLQKAGNRMSSHRISLSNFARPPDAVGQKISHLETILSVLEQMIRILWILLYKQEREFSRRTDNSDISVGKNQTDVYWWVEEPGSKTDGHCELCIFESQSILHMNWKLCNQLLIK